MKLGVMSDSHDNVPKIERAVELFNSEGVELVVHAGDFVAPFAIKPLKALNCRVVAVFGNNDGERIGLVRSFEGVGELHPKLASVTIGERRIAIVHEPEPVKALAVSGMFDIVVYGHTHELAIERNGALVINPGELGGWLSGRSTVAVIDLDTLDATIHEL